MTQQNSVSGARKRSVLYIAVLEHRTKQRLLRVQKKNKTKADDHISDALKGLHQYAADT